MDEYQHYLRVDDEGIVIHGFTTGFELPQEGDVLLEGERGRQFQLELTIKRGVSSFQYLYKIHDGLLVQRSQQELDAEWAARPPAPETDAQKIARLETALEAKDRENKNALFEIYSMLLGGE